MQIDQRKAGVLLNYLSEAVKVITALVYTPFMLRLLGQSEYGLYQLVSSTVSYLSLLSLGFGSAYVRYHARYLTKQDQAGIAKLNGMFLLIFSLMAAVCVFCGSVLLCNSNMVFGDQLKTSELEKAKILLAILLVSMTISFPNSVFSCYIAAHERFVFQKLLNLAAGLLNPFLTLPLLLMGFDSVAVVSVSALLNVATFGANILFCRRKLNMRFTFRQLDLLLLKDMWVFTFFLFLNQIIDQINWSVDKFLLGRISGTAAVAVYGVGGQINSLFVQASTSVSGVFAPKIHQMNTQSEDNHGLLQMMIKIGRIQFMILALVLTGFLLFGQPFVRLWAGEGYEDSYWVAVLLMVPSLIPLIQNIGIEIQRAKNKHRARSVVYFCLAVGNVLLSLRLIELWGSVGAALGTAVVLLLGNGFFMNWYYHHRLGLDMFRFWKEVAKLVSPVVLAAIPGMLMVRLFPMDSWLALALPIVLYTILYCACMWCFGMDAREKNMLLQVIRRNED